MKFFLILGMGMLFFTKGFSQQFRAFVKAGVVASQVHGDQLSGYNKAGIVGGIGVEHPFSSFLGRMEILFIQKGSRKNPTNEDPTKYLMRLNYVEVPVLVQKFFLSQVGLEGGSSWGILLKTTQVEWDIHGLLVSRQPFRRFEWAAHAGLMYKIDEKSQVIFRFSHSILPIRPYPSGLPSYYFYDRGQYNNLISLTYEYHLN